VTGPPAFDLNRRAEAAHWRTERARIIGWLARRYGDLDLAEEATQEAFAAAAVQWRDTLPERPGAWLHTVAHRRLIGTLRTRRLDLSSLDVVGERASDDAAALDRPLGDDLFALLCTCCHPALAREHQIALTLRHVCGLDVEQIAAAFLVSETTMSKRLVRAREKIRIAGVPFRTPQRSALDERADAIRTVIYLTFTEGYLSTGDVAPVRADLCDEAVWLARHLLDLRPDNESRALLALLLTQHARRAARIDDDGELVEFARQDRTRWDGDAIDEARHLLADAQDGSLGRYRVEAAIALLHVAPSGPEWERIADLYSILLRLEPSPVIAVNRAVAVGRADGPRAGLAALEPLLTDPQLSGYAPLHAAHADLLERVGDRDGAARAWADAAARAGSPIERSAILRRVGSADGDDQARTGPTP
jgi:RNA polymerase sigma-70 factor, ECF subfamily